MGSTGVCVVGACNVDLISYVDSMPRIGDTIKGNNFQSGFGGKGANQAVQAAFLGSSPTVGALSLISHFSSARSTP